MKGKSFGTLLFLGFLISSFVFQSCTEKGGAKAVQDKEAVIVDSVKFTYSKASGIGIDSVFNRRDPSDIIKVGDTYYIWYTRMISPMRSGYWGTIWYATSKDEGHTWQEQGMALGLGEKGTFDSHSVFTPNILAYKGKYYMYYTGVQPTPGNKESKFENNSINDFTAIGLAVAESPDGPFLRVKNNPVLEVSPDSAAFDSYRIDDAALLVKDGKICMYYKGRSIIHGKQGPKLTKMSVATADNPEGPFEKSVEPLIEKGHEVLIWQQNDGVASLASLSKSIHFATDGIHFSPIQENLTDIPMAPGLYRPHLEGDNSAKEVPGWGIAMKQQKGLAYLLRFEMTSYIAAD
ncbi:family 43 glycosylhydrolase [Flammeovirgaceae bacterium SG7u.111]|nr:family 43 glycosylhydrolase [Flammeovirgaceae bacterium SG7u.132]WPO37938.1 family 43 glycosylhydrolase [Flammeovirgaceae bacterium SG7u.111]